MADYEKAFKRLAHDEGIKLTDDPTDRGGLTYAGITRKNHPKWEGWRWVDAGDTPPTQLVRDFYHDNYWLPIRAPQITSQPIAEALFSQYVNMGSTGIKLLQTTLGVIADGKVGPKTLAAINQATKTHIVTPEEAVLLAYSVVNTKRYHAIGMKDKTQRRFWPGWIKRALSICTN